MFLTEQLIDIVPYGWNEMNLLIDTLIILGVQIIYDPSYIRYQYLTEEQRDIQ